MRSRARFEKLVKRLPKKPVKHEVWFSEGDKVWNFDGDIEMTRARWEREVAAKSERVIRVGPPESEDE